jgi:Phasin protein
MSAHDRRSANKPQPRFRRKHGGDLKFDFEGRGNPIMVSAGEHTPIKGSGRGGKAKQPGKKTAKESRKPAHTDPKPDQVQEARIQEAQIEEAQAPIEVQAPVVSMESPPAEAAPDAPSAIASPVLAEVPPVEAPPVETPPVKTTSAETAPVSLQTITNAYSDYARQSIEQTSTFFEQLAGTRSISRALELQSEYARHMYETFAAESRRIRELHGEMTMQRLRNLEGFVARMKPPR